VTRTPGGAGDAERDPGAWKGQTSGGETPGAPPVRNRAGRVSGGTRRQGAEKARRRSTAGQASPVSVAARHLMRCRGRNPRRVRPSATARCSARRATRDERSDSGHTLQPSEAHERIRLESIHSSRPEPAGRPRRPTPKGEEAREGSSTNTAIPRTSARLWRTRERQERRRPPWRHDGRSSSRSQDSEGEKAIP
jgi:hypothetical protein